MKRTGIAAIVGSASAALAAGSQSATAVAAPAPALAASSVHLDRISVLKQPPRGEFYPFGNTGKTYNAKVAKTSTTINGYAVPKLIHEALQAQSFGVHTVTGATFTSRAFRATLAGAIHQLAASPSSTTVTSKVHNVLIPVGCSGPCNFPGTPPRYGVLQLAVTGHA